tara:strand:+ start:246 stop:1115 length:870 start_codon:yes stop_codon:yes gene_type:complete
MKIKLLIPIYNDWQSVFKLLENIDTVVKDLNDEISAIIVNDASAEERPEFHFSLNNLKSINVINMKENRGHTRCIAAGLKYINDKEDYDYVIPMDGDGEDRPEEVKLLIEEAKNYPDRVITANRVKRSEGLVFKIGYQIHKYLTYIFTGQNIKFGNFTCLTKSIVNKMIKDATTWSSFSGSLANLAKDRKSISSIRGVRYFGPSKMSYINLLKHSLSIISVFRKTVLVRSIIFLAVYLFLMLQHLSVVTLIPVALVFIMMISIFNLSGRENINELNNALENIASYDNIK